MFPELAELDFNEQYTIVITNTLAIPTTVSLFNADVNADATNYGNPANITITVIESSYAELLAESQTDSFVSSAFFLLKVDNTVLPQLDQPIVVVKNSAAGTQCQYILHPQNYLNTFQSVPIVRCIKPYEIAFTGSTEFLFTMLPATVSAIGIIPNVVTFMLYVKRKARRTNLLYGKPLVNDIVRAPYDCDAFKVAI